MNYSDIVQQLLELGNNRQLEKVFFDHDVFLTKDFQIILRERKNSEKPHYVVGDNAFLILRSMPINRFAKQLVEDAANFVLASKDIDYIQEIANRHGVKLTSDKNDRNLKGQHKKIVQKIIAEEEQVNRDEFWLNHKDEIEIERLKYIAKYKKEIVEQVEKTKYESILRAAILHADMKNRIKQAYYSFGYKDSELGKFGL